MKYLLGEEHVLNMPNCVIGIVFYMLQFILGNDSSTMMMVMNDDDDDDNNKEAYWQLNS